MFMAKRVAAIIYVLIAFFSLVSQSEGFHNNPNFDEITDNATDQRSYNRANANKPANQGGYYGGHDTITAEGMTLKEQVHHGDQAFEDFAGQILPSLRIGAHDEDSTRVRSSDNDVPGIEWRLADPPIGSTGWGGFFDHFFDKNGHGLKGRGKPAPDRAADYLKEIEKIAGCTPGGLDNADGNQKKKAYEYFGKMLHLLQDMAVPSHTTDDAHPFRNNFEKYINDHWDEIIASSQFNDMVTTGKYLSGNFQFTNIKDFWSALAKISRTYPNEEQLMNCYRSPSGIEFCALDEPRMKQAADALVPQAVMYSAGFIDAMYDYLSGNASNEAKCAVLYHFLGPGGDHPDDRFDVSDEFYWEKEFGFSTDNLISLFMKTAIKKGKIGVWYWKRYMEVYAQGVTLPDDATQEMKDSIERQIKDLSQKLDTERNQAGTDMKTAPDVALFAYGFNDAMTSLLLKYKEPVTFIGTDFSPSIVKDQPVMVIPSGGLYGFENSTFLKASLDEYVKQGGTLIVFAQQYGYEFNILPTPVDPITGISKPISGYGWTEDQSCLWNGTYIDTPHQILSGMTASTVSANVDGYFTSYPENSTILLRRTANGQPAMIMYDYGLGKVIVSSLYSDWGYAHSQATQDEIKIVRDMITWVKKPALLPEIRPSQTVSLTLEAKNVSQTQTSSIKLLIYDPDRQTLLSEQTQAIDLPAGSVASIQIMYASLSNSPPGIYHIDYELYDANGNIIQPQAETDSGRFAISNPPVFGYNRKEINFAVNANAEHYFLGNEARFTVTIWNNSDVARTIRTDYLTYHLGIEKTSRSTTIPAKSSVSFVVTVPQMPSQGWFVGRFYDENGAYLGEQWKGVWLDTPSAESTATTDAETYDRNQAASLSINLKNTSIVDAPWSARIRTKVQASSGGVFYEKWSSATLNLHESAVLTETFNLPQNAAIGSYFALVEVYTGNQLISSTSRSFTVPASRMEITPNMPPAWGFGDNLISFTIRNTGSLSVQNGLFNATLFDAEGVIVFASQRPFSLAAGQSTTIEHLISVPALKEGKYRLVYSQSDESREGSDSVINLPNYSFLTLSADRDIYRIGETALISVRMENNGVFRQEGALNVATSWPGISESRQIILEPGAKLNLQYTAAIPFLDVPGNSITASFSEISGRRYSGSAYITLSPFSLDQSISFDKASYRIRDTLNFQYSATNNGNLNAPFDAPLTITIPDIGYQNSTVLQIVPGQQNELSFSAVLPESLAAGQHTVTASMTLPNGTERRTEVTFTVTEPSLKVVYTGPSAIAPEDLVSLNIENTGGIDTTYSVTEITVADSRGNILYSESAAGQLRAGERNQFASLNLPAQTATGAAYLKVIAIDETTGKETALYKILTIDGLSARMEASTSKDIYLNSEFVTALPAIFTDRRPIENGQLNLRVMGAGMVEQFVPFIPRGYWPFSYVSDIVVTGGDTVYVTDATEVGSGVFKYDSQGNFIKTLQTVVNGETFYPDTIAAGPDGSLYMLDHLSDSILKYDQNGNFVSKWIGSPHYYSNHQRSLAVSSDGAVFVADPNFNQLQKYDADGSLLFTVDLQGNPYPGPVYGNRHGMTLAPDGALYIAHSGRHTIQKYDLNGNFLLEWGGFCSTDIDGDLLPDLPCIGQLNIPQSIVLTANGTLAVADTGNNRIVEFDLSGNQISTWGTYGIANGQLFYPRGVTVDSSGRVYVSDDLARIQIFDASGQLIDIWAGMGYGEGLFMYPGAAAIDVNGAMYVVDTSNHRIQKFDKNGRYLLMWGSPGSGIGQFYYPKGIAIGPDGYIYVADSSNDRVQKFDQSGNFQLSWGRTGSGDQLLSYPAGIAVSADGFIFVTEPDRYTVKKFDSNGNYILKWGGYSSSDVRFCVPWGIAATPDGYVYVADGCLGNVQKFDGSGNFVLEWGSWGSGDGQFGGFLPGLSVGPDGSIFVVDSYNHRLQRFDSVGQFLGSWGMQGNTPGYLSGPEGVAVAQSGDVYVVDTDNHRIQRLTRKAGDIRPLFETSVPVNIAANMQEQLSISIGTLNATGKLYLQTELLNEYGQIVAAAEHPFYIVEGTIALALATDRRLYRSGAPVLINGSIRNLSAASASSLMLSLTVDAIEVYSANTDISSDSSYPFSVSLPSLTEGVHTIAGKVVQNGKELASSIDQIEIAVPQVFASETSPDVVGSAPFDMVVELTNAGKLAAEVQLNVSNSGPAEPIMITVPAGEMRQLQLSRQINSDTVFTFAFTGDLNQIIEKTILFGESADLTVNVLPIYKEGSVSVPYEIRNIGLIETSFPVDFELLKNGSEVARNNALYLLPIDGQATGLVNYTLTVGSYLLRYNTKGYSSEVGFEVIKPGQGTLSLPDSLTYPEGSVDIPYVLTNTGTFDAEYNISIGVGSLSNINSVFVPAGATYSGTAHFELAAGEYTVTAEILSYPSAPVVKAMRVVEQKKIVLGTSFVSSQTAISTTVHVSNQGYGNISGIVRLTVQGSQGEAKWTSEQQVLQLPSLGTQSLSFTIDSLTLSPGTYTVVTEFFEGGNSLLAKDIQTLTVTGFVVNITQLPSYRTFDAGQEALFTFRVKNTGNLGGNAELAFKAYDLSDMKRREWLGAGEEKEISFAFILPTDLETKDYFADYELKTGDTQLSIAKGQVKYHLAGISLSVNASLDKQIYTVGDTAHLTVSIQSASSAAQPLFARVNYAGFENQQAFTLNGSTTLTFDIPLSQITGEKLFYGIYHESGRSIHLNSLYIYKAGDVITITTNKQVYNPGETVSVSVTGNAAGSMTLTGPGYSETFDFAGTASKGFALSQTMTAGTYSITADLAATDGQTYSVKYPVDVAGIQVKVLECKNDKGKYASSDTITTELTVSSNTTMPAVLKNWIVDPEGKYTAAGETSINLNATDNALVSRNSALLTTVSGIHRLVYGIYSGELLLVSGSEAFDVGDAVLLGLKTDKTDYPTNTESVLATVTMYGSMLTNVELQLDGTTVKNEAAFLNGFSTLEMDLGSVTPGAHVLKGILTTGGLKSTKETSFVYGSNLPDLTAGLSMQNSVPDQNNALQITATVANQGRTVSAATNVALYDNDSLIETKQVNALNAGETQNITFTWNVLGKTGSRLLKAIVDLDNTVVEFNEANNTAIMNVEIPDLTIATGTDKDIYKINQNAQISATVRNLSSEKIFSGLTLITSAKDPSGNEVYANTATLADIQSLGTTMGTATWNTTGLTVEGLYTISQKLLTDSQVLAQGTNTVTLKKTSDFSMTMVSDHMSVSQGEQATFTANLAPLNGWVSPIMLSLTGLPAGASASFNPGNLVPPGQAQIVITTINATPAGSYTLMLTTDGTDDGDHMAHTLPLILDVSDATPPTGSLMINNNDAFTKTSTVTLNLRATDESGVAKMCISNSPTCTAWETYAASRSWSLSSGDEAKTVSVWYQDSVGNSNGLPYTAAITLDTTAPALTVSTLADGRWTSNELLNISGEATDQSGIQELTVNNVTVTVNSDGSFGCPVLLVDGPNTIVTKVTDLAGNETTDTRTITLDRGMPNITILTPADNLKTNQPAVNVIGTVDEASTVSVRVDGSTPLAALIDGNNFSLTVTPHYGINTIEATATDLAGNSTTAKRTVTFDDVKPLLSVTDPAQDVKTNQANMTVTGEVQDITSIAVTLTMDGFTYSPAINSGRFEQPVVFSEQMTYQVNVDAVDEAGNVSSVQRHVLFDTVGPVVTLNPVSSPTGLTSQVLPGTMETGATVSVSCSTATVSTVTYPTATTWTVTLMDMQEGSNEITVTAMDEVGNIGVPVSATIAVDPPSANITATIEVEPETLNRKGQGNWITVKIELPSGYRASDVDIASLRLEGTVHAEPWPYHAGCSHDEEGKHCNRDGDHGEREFMVKFRKSEALKVLPDGNRVPVHVIGRLGAMTFEGVDYIRVIH